MTKISFGKYFSKIHSGKGFLEYILKNIFWNVKFLFPKILSEIFYKTFFEN